MWGLCAWVWFRFFGVSESKFPPDIGSASYMAQSPTLSKYPTIEYNKETIWEEVERIVEECTGKSFTIGQNLFFQVPFFANPIFFYRPEYDEWIEDVMLMDQFSIPLARSLDEAPAHRMEMYQIIKQELNACQKHQQDKDGVK